MFKGLLNQGQRRHQDQDPPRAYIFRLHRRAELPGDDVSREAIQDRGQIVPTPADDLEVGEVGLPHLVRRGRLVTELVGGLDHDEGGAGDQIMRFEEPVTSAIRAARPLD